MQGTLIVFEGPDGSGSTRQSGALADTLRKQGNSVVLTAQPSESPIGKQIRSMLNGESLPSADAIQLLFCADRADHIATVIQPALDRGDTVICDRYALSTIVYGEAQGVDRAWLTSINEKFPKPDITFVTLPPFEVCMERINRRSSRDQFEMESFQRRVYDLYRSYEDPSAIFVDTSRSKHTVADEIEKKYLSYMDGLSSMLHS